MKAIIDISDLSKKIVELYNSKKIDKSQLKYYYDELVNKKQYKTVAIFIYKRNYLKITRNTIQTTIDKLYTSGILRESLYKSFLKRSNRHMATMYLIKNDHILYTKNGEIIPHLFQ